MDRLDNLRRNPRRSVVIQIDVFFRLLSHRFNLAFLNSPQSVGYAALLYSDAAF